MKKQLTLVASEFERCRKPTPHERSLAETYKVLPWAEPVTLIEPYYLKGAAPGGRPAAGAGADASYSLPALVVRRVGSDG